MFRGIKYRINAIGVPLSSLLLSDMLRVLADMVGYITLPWWIVHRGGAHDLVIYSESIAIATIFAMPLLSPLGDRYAKRPQIVWGVCALMVVAFTLATLASHRSLAIPQNFRVRILAASMMTTQIAGILGPMIAGAALTHWAVSKVYTCFGLATCLLAFGFVLIPRKREFFALNHDQVKDWFRQEYPDAFKTPTVPASNRLRRSQDDREVR